MKIVVATPLYPPEPGGPATYAKALEEGLPGKGIEVVLVKFGEVRHLPKIVRHIAYYLRVRRALKGADLVLALDPVSVGLPACLAAWTLRKPLVVKVVGDYAWEQGQQRFGVTATLDDFVQHDDAPFMVGLLREVQKGVAEYAARIIVPSEYLKGVVVAWGIPKEKITVIYNAVPQGSVGEVPKAVAMLPRPLVATAGRLVPWKHVDSIIDTIAVLRQQGSHVSLAIIGSGPEQAHLEAHAKKALGAHVVFTGALPHEDLLASLASADAFVLNSSYEGLSHLLIEALALGVPTVATDVGGNPEVITHGATGLLVPAGDTDALAGALTRLLSENDLRERVARAAKESVHRFSKGTMIEHTAELLVSFS